MSRQMSWPIDAVKPAPSAAGLPACQSDTSDDEEDMAESGSAFVLSFLSSRSGESERLEEMASVTEAVRQLDVSHVCELLGVGTPHSLWECLRVACEEYQAERTDRWVPAINALLLAASPSLKQISEPTPILSLAGLSDECNPLAAGLVVALNARWSVPAVRLLSRLGAPFTSDVLEQILAQAHQLQHYLGMLALECGDQISLKDLRDSIHHLLEQPCEKEGAKSQESGPACCRCSALHFLLKVFFHHHLPVPTLAHWQAAFTPMLGRSISNPSQASAVLNHMFRLLRQACTRSYTLWCSGAPTAPHGRCSNWQCTLAHTSAEFLVLNPAFREVTCSMLPFSPTRVDASERAANSLYVRTPTADDISVPSQAYLFYGTALHHFVNQQTERERVSNLVPLHNLLLALQSLARALYKSELRAPLPSDLVKLLVSTLHQHLPAYLDAELLVVLSKAEHELRHAQPEPDTQLPAVSPLSPLHAVGASALSTPSSVQRMQLSHVSKSSDGPLRTIRRILSLLPHVELQRHAAATGLLRFSSLVLMEHPHQGAKQEEEDLSMYSVSLLSAFVNFAPILMDSLSLPTAIPRWGSFSLSGSSRPYALKFTHVQHVMHDVKDVIRALKNAHDGAIQITAREHSIYGQKLLWFTPFIEAAADTSMAADDKSKHAMKGSTPPSLRSDESRFGTVRLRVPIRHIFEPPFGKYRYVLGTRLLQHRGFRSSSLEVAHDVLLTEHATFAVGDPFAQLPRFHVSDCALPTMSLGDSQLMHWQPGQPEAVWYCGRTAPDGWDQLCFAAFVPSLTLDNQFDGAKIDFVAHHELCAFDEPSPAAAGWRRCRCVSAEDAIKTFAQACVSQQFDPTRAKKLFDPDVFKQLMAAYQKFESQPQLKLASSPVSVSSTVPRRSPLYVVPRVSLPRRELLREALLREPEQMAPPMQVMRKNETVELAAPGRKSITPTTSATQQRPGKYPPPSPVTPGDVAASTRTKQAAGAPAVKKLTDTPPSMACESFLPDPATGNSAAEKLAEISQNVNLKSKMNELWGRVMQNQQQTKEQLRWVPLSPVHAQMLVA